MGVGGRKAPKSERGSVLSKEACNSGQFPRGRQPRTSRSKDLRQLAKAGRHKSISPKSVPDHFVVMSAREIQQQVESPAVLATRDKDRSLQLNIRNENETRQEFRERFPRVVLNLHGSGDPSGFRSATNRLETTRPCTTNWPNAGQPSL